MWRTGLQRAVLAAGWVVAAGGAARAGDLNPPAGPVAPTQRFLIHTLPFNVTQPGSYVVTRNLAGVPGQNGISILADDVTIDLNGFALVGNGGLEGISDLFVARRNLLIMNGTIRDWANAGAFLTFSTNCQLRNLRLHNNNLEGLTLGDKNHVVNCTIDGNTTTTRGINVGDGCTLEGCTVSSTTESAIVAGDQAVVTRCEGRGANGAGFLLGNRCVLSNCVAAFNIGLGIRTGSDCVVEHCVASNNAAGGMLTGLASLVDACTTASNGSTGLSAGNGSTLRGCTSAGNGTGGSGGSGISVGDGAGVMGCVAQGNGVGAAGGHGIVAASRVLVADCTVSSNRGDGIRLAGRSGRVVRNICSANQVAGTGAGVHILAGASANRIESNHLDGNIMGVDIDEPGNLVFGNTAGNNTTNYEIAAGNVVGEIIAAPASGAISGSTGGAGLGTTDPWANLSF
jgi:hypothetical protein